MLEQKIKMEKFSTTGGRVLGVTALGDSLESAISNAYESVKTISWPHKYCRKDIGKKAYLLIEVCKTRSSVTIQSIDMSCSAFGIFFTICFF